MGVDIRMKFDNHIPEQQLIDFTMGNLNTHEETEVIRHTNQCNHCGDVLEGWRHVLGGQQSQAVQPSKELKGKLWNSIDNLHQPVRKKRPSKLVYGLGSLVAVLVVTVGLLTLAGSTQSSDLAMYDGAQTEPQSHLTTEQFMIIPVSEPTHLFRSRNLFIKERPSEMLVEAEGLVKVDNKDYRLWVIYRNNDIDRVLLPVQTKMNRFAPIKVNIEPPGETILPTVPRTFIVDLK